MRAITNMCKEDTWLDSWSATEHICCLFSYHAHVILSNFTQAQHDDPEISLLLNLLAWRRNTVLRA